MRAIARHYGLEQKAFSDAFNNSKLDVANSLAETNSCPNPFIRQDERRSSQDTCKLATMSCSFSMLTICQQYPLLTLRVSVKHLLTTIKKSRYS